MTLHNNFSIYEIPNDIKSMIRSGFSPYGSFKKTKLFLFLKDEKITNFNEIYDYYSSIKPQRQENEVYDEYKNRLKFQKVLNKFKPQFYDYSIYNKGNFPKNSQ